MVSGTARTVHSPILSGTAGLTSRPKWRSRSLRCGGVWGFSPTLHEYICWMNRPVDFFTVFTLLDSMRNLSGLFGWKRKEKMKVSHVLCLTAIL